MADLVGDPSRLAFEIGAEDGGLRTVDIWLAGRRLTVDDNAAFVPQFCVSIERDAELLESDHDWSPSTDATNALDAHRWCRGDDSGGAERFWFMHWGPTTDNVITFLFELDGQMVITSQFWRSTHEPKSELGAVHEASLDRAELIDLLKQAVDVLRGASAH